jgi:lysozyme
MCNADVAESWLIHEVNMVEEQVARSVEVELTENQFSALVSLVYNIGITQFNKSTLRKNLNKGDYEEAANQFLVWRKGGGKILRGLEIRRAKEKDLFDSEV